MVLHDLCFLCYYQLISRLEDGEALGKGKGVLWSNEAVGYMFLLPSYHASSSLVGYFELDFGLALY